ncbi:MAG: transcription antitermination factor NusB [Dehalococcoidia bacterium]
MSSAPAVRDPDDGAGRGQRHSGRRAARLAAVQALYQIDFSHAEPRGVVVEFLAHRLTETDEEGAPDQAFFSEVVHGACDRRAEIDTHIGGTLPEGWPLPRLDSVLTALLRCAVYELLARPDVPPRVAINEYVGIAHGFFSGKEPGMVNAVLDRVARVVRPEGFESGADTGSPRS